MWDQIEHTFKQNSKDICIASAAQLGVFCYNRSSPPPSPPDYPSPSRCLSPSPSRCPRPYQQGEGEGLESLEEDEVRLLDSLDTLTRLTT